MSEATDAAYRAGTKVLAADFTSVEDDEKATPGTHLNPFGPDRQEERQAWLEGFRDALDGKVAYDPASILKQIDDDLEVSSNAR